MNAFSSNFSPRTSHDGSFVLLLLTLTAFQFVSTDVAAVPVVLVSVHFTDRYAPHSIPGTPVGDKTQIAAIIDSTDTVASPTIAVEAVQGDTSFTLDFAYNTTQIFPGLHVYANIFDFDLDLLGPWVITPTDSTGIGFTALTNAIAAPQFVPYVENIAVFGTTENASVSWTLPDLNGFDVDDVFVRIVDASNGNQLYQSAALPPNSTSFSPPAGVLELDRDYAFRIMLADFSGDQNENRSNTFSDSFRLTIAGDYNQDGIVDAADYTVWRDNLGGTALVNRGVGITGPVGPADYDAWKAHFGQSLGNAAARKTPPVPEPGLIALTAGTLLGLLTFARRSPLGRSRR